MWAFWIILAVLLIFRIEVSTGGLEVRTITFADGVDVNSVRALGQLRNVHNYPNAGLPRSELGGAYLLSLCVYDVSVGRFRRLLTSCNGGEERCGKHQKVSSGHR